MAASDQLGGSDRLDRMLDVRSLRADLRERSIRGGMISVIAQAAKLTLHLGTMAVLARLLTPSDFGLLAMVTAVTWMLLLFKDTGLSTATVQAAELDERQVNMLFWINVALSAALAGIGAGLASPMAQLFDEPRVTVLMLALSAGLVLTGLGSQHQALLRRAMRFRALAWIDLASVVTGGAAGIVTALLGGGVWALVTLELSRGLSATALAWITAGWTPGLPARCNVWGLIRVGGGLTGTNVMSSIAWQSGLVLMSTSWGAATLGLYTRAHALLTLPQRQLVGPLSGVAIPMMSRLMGEPDRYQRAAKATLTMVGVISAGIAAWMIVGRDWIVAVMLGPQWTETAAIFGLLGFGAFAQPVFNVCGWMLVSQGRVRDLLHLNAVDGVLKVVAVIIGLPWGPLGVAAAISLRYAIELPVMLWFAGRTGPVTLAALRRMVRMPLLAFGGMLIVLQTLRLATGVESIIGGLALTGAAAGVCMGALIAAGTDTRRAAAQAMRLLAARTRRPKHRTSMMTADRTTHAARRALQNVA